MNPGDAPEDPALREGVVTVARCLHDQVDTIATRIAAGIRDALEREGFDAAQIPLDDHKASVLSAERAVMGFWLEGRSLTPDEVDAVRQLGVRRARQGLSLKSLQVMVAVARDIGWEYFLACAECLSVEVRRPVLARMSLDLFRISDEFISAITRGHAQVRQQERTSFFAQLLAADLETAQTLSALAPAFGIDLDKPHGLFVMASAQAAFYDVCKVARSLADELGGCDVLAEASATAYATVVVEADGAEHWAHQQRRAAQMLAASPTIAIAAGPVLGAIEIRRAHADALAVVPVTFSMDRNGTVVPARELRLHRLFVDLDRQLEERFIDETVGPLLKLPGDVRDRLLRTLRALDMSGGRLVAAAKALGVSEQTVRNRLATVRSLVDPDVRPDELAVALCLVDVLGKPSVTADRVQGTSRRH